MKTKTPKLPIYSGPELEYGDHAKAVKMAGPAPDGWRYLSVGERIPKGKVMFIHGDVWAGGEHAIGELIHEGDFPWAVPHELEYIGSETDFLRLRVTRRNPKKVTFVIDSQRRQNFGQFEASNGVRIASSLYPQLEAYKRDSPRLFVRGILSLRDSDPICATASQFKLIAAAVQEFNLSKAEPAKVKPTKLKVDPSARIRELEAEVASLKAFKEGVEALLKN